MARKVLLWGLLSALAVVSAGCVIDQQQTVYGTGNVPSINGSSNQILAQTVTVGEEGGLVSIKVVVFCIGSPADVTLEVRGTTSNVPNDTIFASKTVNVPVGQSATPPMVEFKLNRPVYFATNALFAFSLTTSGQCAAFDGPDGDQYLLGNAFFKNNNTSGNWSCFCASTSPPRGFDLMFETKVNTLVPGPRTFAATGLASDPPARTSCFGSSCTPELISLR